jgi:hypothetical protein
MKVVIFGSRSVEDFAVIEKAMHVSGLARLAKNGLLAEIVSGGARGVDKLGEQYARSRCIPYKIFPADWERYGKNAGYIRNTEMAKYADSGLALWDGQSRGTAHMIRQMEGRLFLWRTDLGSFQGTRPDYERAFQVFHPVLAAELEALHDERPMTEEAIADWNSRVTDFNTRWAKAGGKYGLLLRTIRPPERLPGSWGADGQSYVCNIGQLYPLYPTSEDLRVVDGANHTA